MKTRYKVLIAIVIVGTISFLLNYHVEYLEHDFAYAFCEQILFSGRKTCTVIWQESNCPGGGCLFK